MTVAAVYDATLSRVRVDADGLGVAPTAVVERSTDQVRWTTVRGGVDVPVAAGVMSTVDDYEFVPDGLNYYRVTYEPGMSYVGVGTVSHGNNASVTPGLPGSIAEGDLLLMIAAIRNSGAGTPDTPTGWTLLVDSSNFRLFGKIAGPSESGPTVTFTGGAAEASTSAQISAFRGVALDPIGLTQNLNPSGQDIDVGALTLASAVDHAVVLHAGWKQDDWTSVTPVASGTEIAEQFTTTGDDQGITWAYRLITTFSFSAVAARFFDVFGGAAAISRGILAVFEPSTVTQSASVTPVLGTVWIKNLSRPFLNRAITVTDWGDITREARNGVFPIVGRTMPVAVTDLRLSRTYELVLTTSTVDEAEELDLCLASGEPILVHVPADCDVPGMYAVVGNVTVSRRNPRSPRRYITLPLTESAAPGPDVVGATNTWAAVIATYATWADVIAANATWQDVLDGVADPGDVVVD